MSSDQANILKRQEQISHWLNSETDKASNKIKEADKIKFPKEVQFFCACNSNDWDEIDRLLSEGVNINCSQDDGLTALHQACIDEDLKLVKFLCEHGAEVDAKDKEGWTPLCAAISCNYLLIVKYLLVNGAKLDVVSLDGELPVDQTNDQELISYLKNEMAKRNIDAEAIKNEEKNLMLKDVEQMRLTSDFSNFFLVCNGATMLHVAASKDYTDVLEQLLQILPQELLNRTDEDGWNALHVAAHWGHKHACIMLLDADIDFDHCTNTDQTVLEVSDEDIKSYLREEIRKARFRMKEKGTYKRPAQPTPTPEFKPSDNKIICQNKDESTIQSNGQTPPSEDNLQSSDKVSSSSDAANNQIADSTTSSHPTGVLVTMPTDTPTTQSNTDDDDIKNNNKNTQDQNNMPTVTSNSPTDLSISTTTTTTSSNKEEPTKKPEKAKMSAVMTPTKSQETEVQRLHEANQRRREKKVTQPIDKEEVRRIIESMTAASKDDESAANKASEDSSNNNICINQSEAPASSKDVATTTGTVVVSSADSPSDAKPPTVTTTTAKEETVITPPEDTNISVSSATTADVVSNDRRKRSGGHVVNKKRVRDRPPTQTVDIKDIQAAHRLDAANGQSEEAVVSVDAVDKSQANKDATLSSSKDDYKALYESEVREKEKLARNLARLHKELQQTKDKLSSIQSNTANSGSSSLSNNNHIIQNNNDPELERLREENKKMKESNAALIRVITRLSSNSRTSPQSNKCQPSATATATTTTGSSSSS